MSEEVHIGKLIKQKIKEKKIKVTYFANIIGCSRRNVYEIYNKRSIDIELLKKISTVLNEDLISIYQKSSVQSFSHNNFKYFSFKHLMMDDSYSKARKISIITNKIQNIEQELKEIKRLLKEI